MAIGQLEVVEEGIGMVAAEVGNISGEIAYKTLSLIHTRQILMGYQFV